MDKKSFDEIIKLQKTVANDLNAEADFNSRIQLIEIARSVCKVDGLVSVESLYLEASIRGLEEDKLDSLISVLVSDGFFSQEGDGYLRIVS